MNYVNYVENNNFFIVLPDYIEHNKENINFANVNIDSSKYYPTHSSYTGENLKADAINQIQMNIQSKREPSTAVTDKLIDIVSNKYVENQINMKNMIHGDYFHPNANHHLGNYPPSTEFKFSKQTFQSDYPQSINHSHNIPSIENIYYDTNLSNYDMSNLNINHGEQSAYQSTNHNISMTKYHENSCVNNQNGLGINTLNNFDDKKLSSHKCSIYDKYISQIPHEFLFDIWETLRYEEELYSVGAEFMKNQKDINEKMRAILVDWLVEVHQRFNLTPETLFITVNLIDRFLSKRDILRTQLQLVGVAALFIACKYEEILCPDIRDFVYITDKTYSKIEILKIEREILTALNFDICVPTSLRMFEIISLNFNFNEVEFAYGKYLLESFLIDPKCNKYSQSTISCAVAYIIMKMNYYPNYQDVYKITSDNNKTLKDCAKDIYYFSCNVENMQFKAVHKKYSTRKFYFVAVNGMGELGTN